MPPVTTTITKTYNSNCKKHVPMLTGPICIVWGDSGDSITALLLLDSF